MDKLAISVEEAAKLLGVSRPLAYELAHRADFPSLRVGKNRIVVSVKGLEEWVYKQAQREQV